jgi:uncharacterized protein
VKVKKRLVSRPQDPQKPYPYREEELVYKNEKDNTTLSATLTIPFGKGSFPAVILIAGGGPTNRDGFRPEIEHRPFLVLSDYLTRHGISVLRVDKRGVGGSTGNVNESTTIDFAYDVLAGVEQLKKRRDINPKQIGLIGHSEGGIIAPIAAVELNDIAFIITMAGAGITGEETLILQIPLFLKVEGVSNKDIALNIKAIKKGIEVRRNIENTSDIKTELDKIYTELFKDSPVQILSKEWYIEFYSTLWAKYYFDLDPKYYLEKVKCPILAVIGEKDLQVLPKVNLEAIENSLIKSGNKDYKVIEVESLNHFFQTAETGSPMEYAKIDETLSPVFLELVKDWILDHSTE